MKGGRAGKGCHWEDKAREGGRSEGGCQCVGKEGGMEGGRAWVPEGVGYTLTMLHSSSLCFPVIYISLCLPSPSLWSLL